MTEIFSITEIEGITIIVFEVAPSYNQVVSCIDELAAIELSRYRLWDLSEVEFDLSSEDMRKLSSYGSKKKYAKSIKAAFLATNDLSFGQMRQFEVYREDYADGESRIFRSRTKAIEWLNKQD